MTVKTLTKQLEKLEEQILTIRHEIRKGDYADVSGRSAAKAWERLGGALQHRGRVDAVKWQRKIRREWDHRTRPRDL